jgi:hypothetical protein
MNRNLLQYNNNFDHPLIIGGWNILSEYVGFQKNVDVVFAYYGYRCFEILSFHDIADTKKIKSFHSRSTHPSTTKWFDIKLTEEMVQKSELVK